MTQVWFPRRNLTVTVSAVSQTLMTESAALLSTVANTRTIRRWGPWSVGALAVSLLWSSEWRLLLATGLGIGSVKLIFWVLTHRESLRGLNWRQSLHQPQTQLLLAGGSGGLVALGTYIATMVWSDVNNPWIASGIILQGLGSLTTVGLLVGHIGKTAASPATLGNGSELDHCLHTLANGDRLQKFVALRQLAQLSQSQRLTRQEQGDLWDYLQVFLEIEADPRLKRAAIAILQPQSVKPLTIPQTRRQRQVINADS
ncbi:MAG: hypothetical protein ACO36E_03150 [Synechocystis sp.]